LALGIGAAPATASVTLGQLAPTPTGSTSNNEFLQLSVASGSSYTVPATGTITSWSHNAQVASGQQMTMKVYRKTREPNFYKVVGLSGPKALTGGIVNTFPTSIPVQAGDVLGAEPVAGSVSILFPGPAGDTFLNHLTPPSLGVGDEAGFTGPNTGGKLNLSAVFEPSNTVTVGATTLNKKKGTATLNLTLPNPGDLTASGTGVTASSAAAHTSAAVSAGPVQLLVKATGKKRKKLNKKGKVSVAVTVTYTPENGAPAAQTVTVKLQKKHKKKHKK
jgi:hypothetical protein